MGTIKEIQSAWLEVNKKYHAQYLTIRDCNFTVIKNEKGIQIIELEGEIVHLTNSGEINDTK